jgi:hypothetical protein
MCRWHLHIWHLHIWHLHIWHLHLWYLHIWHLHICHLNICYPMCTCQMCRYQMCRCQMCRYQMCRCQMCICQMCRCHMCRCQMCRCHMDGHLLSGYNYLIVITHILFRRVWYALVILQKRCCSWPILQIDILLNRNESGRLDALKYDSTHHFFRNACTKSGSLRFSAFRLLTDFVCIYNYEFWLFLCKIVRRCISDITKTLL